MATWFLVVVVALVACDRVRAAAAAAIFLFYSTLNHPPNHCGPRAQIRLLSAFFKLFLKKEEMKYGFAFRLGRWGKAAVYQLQQENSLARI